MVIAVDLVLGLSDFLSSISPSSNESEVCLTSRLYDLANIFKNPTPLSDLFSGLLLS